MREVGNSFPIEFAEVSSNEDPAKNLVDTPNLSARPDPRIETRVKSAIALQKSQTGPINPAHLGKFATDQDSSITQHLEMLDRTIKNRPESFIERTIALDVPTSASPVRIRQLEVRKVINRVRQEVIFITYNDLIVQMREVKAGLL